MTAGVAVIGAGAAGMGAALSALRHGARDVLVLEREDCPGGVMRQCIHSGFSGDSLELTGPEHAGRLYAEAVKAGVRFMFGALVTDIRGGTVGYVSPRGAGAVRAGAVVLASGCREKTAAELGIAGSRPSGIYTAGEAQRMMNLSGLGIGGKAVVLGGGDIGLIVARRLLANGKQVVCVVEQNGVCGALPRNQMLCLREYGIPLLTRHTVTEVFGSGRIEGCVLTCLDTGETRRVSCDALILAAGLVPDASLACGDGRVIVCGNAEHIHTTVEQIALSAEEAGAAAAELLRGGTVPARVTPGPYVPRALAPDETVCLLCHRGCVLSGADGAVEGAQCPRGAEFYHGNGGRRYRSSTVRVAGSALRLPVRTDRPVTREEAALFLLEAERLTLRAPVAAGSTVARCGGFGITACAGAD